MKRIVFLQCLLWVFLLTFAMSAAPPALADETVSGTFTTSGQSPWSSGPAFAFNYSSSPSVSLDSSNSIGGITGGCVLGVCAYAGGTVDFATNGSLGVDVAFHVDAGTVSAAEPASFTVTAPSTVNLPFTSATATVNSTLNGFGLRALNTTAPTVSASVDAFLSIGASIDAKACVVGCLSGSVPIRPYGGTVPLASFDSAGSGQLKILGQNTGYGLGQPVYFEDGNVVVTVNNLANTAGSGFGTISSTGTSNVLGASVNVAGIVADAFGVALDGSGSLDDIGSASWSVLSVNLTLANNVTQNFDLNPTGVLVDYHVEQTGADYIGPVGTPMNIGFDGFKTLDIVPTYFLNASLSNSTSLCIDPGANISALSGHVNLFDVLDQDFGPVLGPFTWEAGCVAGPIDIYNNTFDLGGWTAIQGDQFEITNVPEPGTLLLLASGFTLFGFVRRGRSLRARG